MHLPQQWKLSGDTYQETKNMLNVKANKTMIQQHIYRNTGKIVTLKDLHNLGSDKDTSSNDLIFQKSFRSFIDNIPLHDTKII